MTKRTKTEILIAVLLIVCLLFGVAVMVYVENHVGDPSSDVVIPKHNITITEICSSNKSIIANDIGEFPDYIELYNGGETFSLADFALSNDIGNSIAYTFGDIEFKANSYLIVYLDGKTIPFRLNAGGNEYIALISREGTILDSVTTLATDSNQVMLRNENGFELSYTPSPGYPNTAEGAKEFLSSLEGGEISLSLNEILTSNDSALPDFEGDFCDIIEIKNTSSAIVSTKGYFLSDSATERNGFALPEKELAPGELLTVFASGKNRTAENGEIHSNFKISVGETVTLSFGNKYSSQEVLLCDSNVSQSLGENGEFVKMSATPGFENTEFGVEELLNTRIDKNAPIVINELLLSQDDFAFKGALRDVIELCNISDSAVSTKGYYLSDSEDEPYKYAIPERTLSPNECLLIFADRSENEFSSGFSLSSGESVYLTHPNFKRSESVNCNPAGNGLSRSRVVENGEVIYIDSEITLGFENSDRNSFISSIRPTDVEISEAVAMNKSYLPGPYKTFHDFVELRNLTDKELDLSGYFLSDDVKEPRKGSLDGIKIPAKGFVVIILSSDGINTPSGYHVLNFGLSSSGETLCLSKGDDIIDMMIIPSLAADTSFGRANGEDGFSVLETPTPNAQNSAKSRAVTVTPTSNIPQGVYPDSAITVELLGEGDIYYTLDCSEPTTLSARYDSPLKLNKTTVIRCFSVAQGKKASKTVDLSFIINEPDTLETLSLVTTPENLWDYYTGIYETGPNAGSVFPYEGANYYNRWEREASVSFFANDGSGFSEKCGIRIFGGLSRALPKKSFGCFFRSSYGAGELSYRLFEDYNLDTYEAFVLRNTGQDWKYTAFRDAMLTSIAHDKLGIDTQNCRPIVLYLNGEYWGIYFIREKLNEHYVAGHYNCDASEAQVTVASGKTSDDYQALVNYASSHDLSVKANYDHVASLMDIENYIDYIVAQSIIANGDNGNIRFFTYKGGKWRWIMYDVDQSFRTASYDTIAEHLNPAGTGSGDRFPTRLINALLKNPDFKKKFLEEYAYQLKNVWSPEIVNSYIDEFSSLLKNDIDRDRTRWEHTSTSWDASVNSLRTFIENREQYVIKYVKAYFHLSDAEMKSYGFNV